MAAISAGPLSRPGKKPKPTQTTKQHRFEPFSRRIARLKIDPIHRVSRKVNGARPDTSQSSHFRESLEDWTELNLSQNFTEFSRKASPLCETLPQLLFHADTLAQLLLEYIGKRDVLSLESLLSLLAHFAHDLGARFEKYFADSVSLVADVAATHNAPEAIEWSFTCLAWIFKFLSKLLVPDLRPLLAIMVRYLGKSRQREHITRFAAESMSFLIRKAAIIYSKNQEPLRNAISYLLSSLSDTTEEKGVSSYKSGIMSLLSETTKGVDNGIHECGPAVFRSLMDDLNMQPTSQAVDVLLGVWTNMIHHATPETAVPLFDLLYNEVSRISEMSGQIQHSRIEVATHLAFVTAGTRKGSRVRDWAAFNQAAITLVRMAIEQELGSMEVRKAMVTTVALGICYSPLDGLLTSVNAVTRLVLSGMRPDDSILFFSLIHKLSPNRLVQFFASTLQQFVNKQWQSHEAPLLALLIQPQDTDGQAATQLSSHISIPDDWETALRNKLRKQSDGIEAAALTNACLDLIQKCRNEPSDHKGVFLALHEMIRDALVQCNLPVHILQLTMGRGFTVYTHLARQLSEKDQALSTPLCQWATSAGSFPAFWAAFLDFIDLTNGLKAASAKQKADLQACLLENLLSDDISVKQAALEILRQLWGASHGSISEALQLADEILKTPYTLQSVRQLVMLIRNLSILWQSSMSDSEYGKFIPFFLLGLLSPKAPELHKEISEGLATICASSSGEAVIPDVLGRWLHADSEVAAPGLTINSSDGVKPLLTPFHCLNVESLRELVGSFSSYIADPMDSLRKEFEHFHRIAPQVRPSARSLAIIVLQSMPQLAEKRSRQIVPLLLSSINFDNPTDWSPASDSSDTSVTLSAHEKVQYWTRRDRKAILELFGKFRNPKVLFRSADVYSALLDVLSKGDAEMQKLALKAIFSYKQPSIRPYEEHLENMTDDKRIRDELTVFFNTDPDSSSIEQAHRSELLPVVLRLLYGQMINRSGSRSTHGGQDSRRKLILRTLSRLEEGEIRSFILIGCGPLATIKLGTDRANEHVFSHDVIPATHQYGLLNTVETMLETLQGQLTPYASILQTVVLYCLIRAVRCLNRTNTSDLETGESMFRRNRRLALRCLDLLFTHCPELDWNLYLSSLFKEVIDPRLDDFAIETAQGTSGLLRIFGTWASSIRTVPFFSRFNQMLLPTISSCLTVTSAQDPVKIFVLNDVLGRLSEIVLDSENGTTNNRSILEAHITSLLTSVDTLLRSNPSRAVQDAAISTLSKLSNFATSPESSTMLVGTLTMILRQPTGKVTPQTKGHLLKALLNLLKVSELQVGDELHQQIFDATSALFNYFKDRANRSLLVDLTKHLATRDFELQISAEICAELNAFSTTRLDEVDYDRRLQAFTGLLEVPVHTYNSKQWSPILHNVIFFCREEEDFAIRSNAVAMLKVFIQQSSIENSVSLRETRRNLVYPALKRGLKAPSESIRADHLTMIGNIVQYDPEWEQVNDMQGLLASNDEEASFFTNALHIQQHRRLRSLRRLESELKAGVISSANVTTIFLPLLEHFIFEPDDDPSAQNLAGQAIATIGSCLEATEWSQYKAIFRRYKSYMSSKPELEKNVIKLLSAAADSLYRSVTSSEKPVVPSLDPSSTLSEVSPSRLAFTLPSQQKLSDELTTNFIPELTTFVHQKDEAQMSLRIPIAIATVRLVKVLSEEKMSLLLPPVLLDVCNILKSRVQESRDTARRTLAEISSILGANAFGYILKELRTSLARGYQLHVLSYTVHSLLVLITEKTGIGDMDYCLPSLVAIILDDIFGVVGQEKDAEDYISKMKEVKSSKSFDSMELLARVSTVGHLAQLVTPIQALLSENLNTKQARQIDELLRRVGVGLSRNTQAGTRDILVFCFEIIQGFYKQRSRDNEKTKVSSRDTEDRFLVDLKMRRHRQPGHSASVFAYKSVRFALDVLRSTLAKHVDLLSPENVHGFIPIIGDVLVEGQEDVRTSAMRLLSTIIKLPLSELDEHGQLYAMQAVKVVKDSTSTNTESAQAALKLVTSILRDRQQVQIRESDLSYLLHRIAPDLDEPDRQGVTFNFVKAVMYRKVALPELYDLLDQIGVMMVTNHTRGTRDAARGVYIHFILDYPQSRNRWSKQLKFLVKNLDYEHAEGRQSVMEAIHGLLAKSGKDVAQEMVASFFIPVLLLLSNDNSIQCREMAAALLSQLFGKAEEEQLSSLLSSLRAWVGQAENAVLVKAGMQAYKIFFDGNLPRAEKEIPFVKARIQDAIANDNGEADGDSWEPTYYSLQLLLKLCSTHPEVIMSKRETSLWNLVLQMLDHRHQWVQHSSAKLLGSLFHDLGRANAEVGLQKVPLSNSRGLDLQSKQMIHGLKSSLRIIKSPLTGADLRLQSVRNIVFLGRCFTVNSLAVSHSKAPRNIDSDPTKDHASSDSSDDEDQEITTIEIPAINYLFNALSTILRREPRHLKTAALHPKLSSLTLLGALLNHYPSPSTLSSTSSLTPIFIPLLHLTSPNLPTPRVADPTFQSTYSSFITSATELLDLIQQKLGPKLYVEEISKAQRSVREKREERGRKRKVERVVDPEGYAKEKKRRRDGEKRRKKERGNEFKGRRRGY